MGRSAWSNQPRIRANIDAHLSKLPSYRANVRVAPAVRRWDTLGQHVLNILAVPEELLGRL